MKLLLTLFLCCLCANHANTYFFPLCLDRLTCLNYFGLGSTPPEMKEQDKVPLEVKDHEQDEGRIKLLFYSALDYLVPFVYGLETTLTKIHKAIYPYSSKAFHYFATFLVPVANEKVIKTNNNLYFLFIAGSIATYLILYIYFTKKLIEYYRTDLRSQYLQKVTKIFRTKE